jgi:hypothetical protein
MAVAASEAEGGENNGCGDYCGAGFTEIGGLT